MKISSLNQFDNTPRQLPVSVKLSVSFLNVYFLMGAVFTFSGLVVLLIFSKASDLGSAFATDINTTTKGVITNVEDANARENKKNLYEFYYSYKNNSGTNYTGVSFSTHTQIQQGDTVTVLYSEEEPTKSYIEGMRASLFPGWVMLMLLGFPIIGIITLVIHFMKVKKNLYLLANGTLTYGKVVSKTPTATKINNRTVYAVTFEFKDNKNNIIRSTLKTHRPERIQNEEKEPVIYLSDKPEKAVMLDALPSAVRKFLESGV